MRELAEHHAVELVGLAGRGAEAITSGLDLVGMDREHCDAAGQQPADKQPVGTLDRRDCHGALDEQRDQRADAVLVVGEASLAEQVAVAVGDANVVPLVSPIILQIAAMRSPPRIRSLDDSRPGGTVAGAHRRALSGATPVAALGASPPGGAGLTRAVTAASTEGPLLAVVSSAPVSPRARLAFGQSQPPTSLLGNRTSRHERGCPEYSCYPRAGTISLSPKLPTATPRGNEAQADALRRVQWEELRRPPERKTNRDIAAALLRSNIDFNLTTTPPSFTRSSRFATTGRAARTSALLTGSANWTETDCHKNLNHVIVFHNAKVCAEYQREFDEIRGGSFGRRQHGNVPAATNIGGIPVKILFAPDHTPELEIVKQMLRARQRLDFAIFTFAGSSAIDDAMVMLRRAGVAIRGALDPSQGRQSWAATPWLHDSGIEVSFPKQSGGSASSITS